MPQNRRNNYWVEIPELDTAICTPPKCGTGALAVALSTYIGGPQTDKLNTLTLNTTRLRRVTPLEVRMSRRVMIVRHPVSRLQSVFANKIEGRGGRITPRMKDKQLRGVTTMQQLVDRVEEIDNVHWRPQVLFEGGVSTEQVRLEDFTWWWSDNMHEATGVNLVPANVSMSNRVHVSPELRRRICRIYRCDYSMYTDAKYNE